MTDTGSRVSAMQLELNLRCDSRDDGGPTVALQRGLRGLDDAATPSVLQATEGSSPSRGATAARSREVGATVADEHHQTLPLVARDMAGRRSFWTGLIHLETPRDFSGNNWLEAQARWTRTIILTNWTTQMAPAGWQSRGLGPSPPTTRPPPIHRV